MTPLDSRFPSQGLTRPTIALASKPSVDRSPSCRSSHEGADTTLAPGSA
jgi:hypothetical protein